MLKDKTMTENSRDTIIIFIIYLLTLVFICIFNNYSIKIGLENDLKDGKIRLFDNQYTCQMTGKYVLDERFIPKEIDEKHVKELLKEYEKYNQEIKERK